MVLILEDWHWVDEASDSILKHMAGNVRRLPLSLEVLIAQELVQQVRRAPEAAYMFKHVLTQVAVYESLLLKKRKACHTSEGRALEELYAGRLEEQCENLAHHHSQSTHTEKALLYLEMAAAKAARVHSLPESRRDYETELSIVDASPLDPKNRKKFIDLTLGWAEVSQYAPSNKIMRALGRSLDLARRFDSRHRVARVSYWVGKYGHPRKGHKNRQKT
ncbi:hypothetical protein DSCA_28880 [Desulfosarcina alkanivorans]|uniref:Uncharacterized protein n=1 Tax=Desulfosarcina alkanivorans TaxID=571177 RepID=A0A5K7YJ61_9BACT|nr:hypothetical protein [Desulfosarcina alkanivorans]BBO68958.1 hypothetical protein DSCA_28880 [Desulfosarcina alkanivorans]